MSFNSFGLNSDIETIIRERRRDCSVVEALELGKLPGRFRTGFRAVPSSSTDLIAGDAVGDVVTDLTYIYTLISVSSALVWDRKILSLVGTNYNLSALYTTTADFTKSDTTAASVTGLVHTVIAGATYKFSAGLFVTADSTGRSKSAMNGTATATTFKMEATSIDNAGNVFDGALVITALGNTITTSATVTDLFVKLEGTIIVNAGGTFGPFFAQVSASGSSSVEDQSWFEITKK